MQEFVSKYKKWVFYFFYFLLFLAVFTIGYKLFNYAKLKAATPKYKLAEDIKEIKNNFITQETRKNPTSSIFKKVKPGILVIAFKNQIFNPPILDTMSIRLDNAYVIFASDNNPSYQQYDYSIKKNKAAFLVLKDNSKTPELFTGKVLGARLPNAFKGNKVLIENLNITDIALSPSTDKIAFVVKSYNDSANSIYIYFTKEHEVKKLTQGIRPKWIDDEHFIFIQNKTLKVFNIDKKEIFDLWKPSVNNLDVADVSKNGKVLAVYLPEFNRISILKLYKDNKNYQIEQMGSIESKARSLALSPQGKYLAVLKGKPRNWNIDIYNLKDFKKSKSVLDRSDIFEFHYSDFAELSDWY